MSIKVSSPRQRAKRLSGGNQQKLVLAKALLTKPEILILDEPTNHLDIQYQLQILRVVKSLGIEVFAAMHDLNLAIDYCDYLYVMSRGASCAEGTPETILEPDLDPDGFWGGIRLGRCP